MDNDLRHKDIRSFIETHPIIDVHEHHMPWSFLSPDVNLLMLFDQSYAGWTRQRPYPLHGEEESPDDIMERSKTGGWPEIEEYLIHHGTSAFVRNLLQALTELYDLGERGVTAENYKALDEELSRRHKSKTWVKEVLDRSNLKAIITDAYEDPLLNVRKSLGERYRSVIRINGLAMSPHPELTDHNRNTIFGFAERLGLKLNSFDDLMPFLEKLLDTMAIRNQVGLKNALAYDRSLDFDEVDEDLARRAWGNPDPSKAELKAYGDVMVDRICRLAGERDIPMQIHSGAGLLREAQPIRLAGLIERHPKTRFLIMHLGYPWAQDVLGMAFVYRNVWLDLTWSWLLSPSYFKRVLHEAIEVIPKESQMMLGGDNWHVEETYGTFKWLRKLLSEVLEEKLSMGYFTLADAKRIARKILHDNAAEFFGVAEPLGDSSQ